MTIQCRLPRSGNYLFEPSGQHFNERLVQSTPVIIKAENENLPVRFINHMRLLCLSTVMLVQWKRLKN